MESIPDQLIGIRYQYQLNRLLGQGISAYVVEAKLRNSNQTVVIKYYHGMFRPANDEFAREYSAFMFLRPHHPNIIRLFDRSPKESQTFFLVLEKMDYDLEHAPVMSMQDAGSIAEQLFRGLNFIHEKGGIHGDVHLRNLLVKKKKDGFEAKISDFGNFCKASIGEYCADLYGEPEQSPDFAERQMREDTEKLWNNIAFFVSEKVEPSELRGRFFILWRPGLSEMQMIDQLVEFNKIK